MGVIDEKIEIFVERFFSDDGGEINTHLYIFIELEVLWEGLDVTVGDLVEDRTEVLEELGDGDGGFDGLDDFGNPVGEERNFVENCPYGFKYEDVKTNAGVYFCLLGGCGKIG